MKSGRLSEAAQERSVQRPFREVRGAAALPASVSVCCEIGADLLPDIRMILGDCAGRIFSLGRRPAAVSLQIVWPAEEPEEKLKKIMEDAADLCRREGISLLGAGGCVSLSSAVPAAAVTMAADGPAGESSAAPGDDLVIAGQIGLPGTAVLASWGREALTGRFPASFVERSAGYAAAAGPEGPVPAAAKEAALSGAGCMCSGGEGGVFAALRELALKTGLGFTASLRDIPVRQETIEICEYYDIDPYRLYSPGILLACVKDGEKLCRQLCGSGIAAVRIGKMTAGRDRILKNGDEVRWLEKRQQDSLWSFREKEERKSK